MVWGGGAPVSAQAQTVYSTLEGVVPIEVEIDRNYRTDDPAAHHTQMFATVEPEVTLHFSKSLSLFVHAVLEPTAEPGPAESRYFEDYGVTIEDISLHFQTERFSAFAGKFTPNFGRAWDLAPGLYGADVAETNYEFTERIGIGGALNLPAGDAGRHTLSASGFFLDTSPLAHSLGQSRGTRSRADGGISNTEDFSSFAMAVDGRDLPDFPALNYHVAYSHQRAGQGGTADQNGVVFGTHWAQKLSGGFSLDPVLVEWAHLEDAAGVADQDRDILTLGAQLNWRNWNLAVSYSGRETDTAAGPETKDLHFQVSVGYAFENGIGVDVGWVIDETDELQGHTAGALLAYEWRF